MTYTVRYAHLESSPVLKVGDIIHRGQIIGRMGSSGQSTKAHLHLDGAEGSPDHLYSLADMEAGDPKPIPLRQLLHFIDSELFGVDPFVTTHYACHKYFAKRKKVHLGYDLVPIDRHQTQRHFDIKWNRSMPGKVTRVAYDPDGYGYHIYISFEV